MATLKFQLDGALVDESWFDKASYEYQLITGAKKVFEHHKLFFDSFDSEITFIMALNSIPMFLMIPKISNEVENKIKELFTVNILPI